MSITDVTFGLDSFGDIPVGPDGQRLSHAAAIRQVLAEAIAADERDVDVVALGEHHRDDFAISSPETVLAGIATRTERITLASGVTVLSSDDPVRVFERFATLDALSNGRAQVILGRGSFTESFPLFGFDLADYNDLFEEKVELFAELLKEEPVTWEGRTRAALHQADVFPKTESGRLQTWIGVGGSPESVVRAAHYGFPLMIAIIGGPAERFIPYVDLYHRATTEFGTGTHEVGIHSPGHIAETDEEALETFWPPFKVHRDRIGRERTRPRSARPTKGRSAAPTRAETPATRQSVAKGRPRPAPLTPSSPPPPTPCSPGTTPRGAPRLPRRSPSGSSRARPGRGRCRPRWRGRRRGSGGGARG